MSEYWKSTPKYWCKYCETYVKDTPLEKNNHESSPRHQGNLKRSLRDLHRNNDRAERDKQYAKAEAARLNGTGPSALPTDSGSGKFGTSVNFTKQAPTIATGDDRKRQMAQLAALGVAVPDSFRVENAMVGDWKITSQKVIWDGNAGAKAEEEIDVKPGLNVGVRRPKVEEKDEDEEDPVKLEEGKKRPRYGRDVKALPEDDEDDLDALLGSTRIVKKHKPEPKAEFEAKQEIKKEESQEEEVQPETTTTVSVEADHPNVKEEDEAEDTGSMFKKRKRPGKPK